MEPSNTKKRVPNKRRRKINGASQYDFLFFIICHISLNDSKEFRTLLVLIIISFLLNTINKIPFTIIHQKLTLLLSWYLLRKAIFNFFVGSVSQTNYLIRGCS